MSNRVILLGCIAIPVIAIAGWIAGTRVQLLSEDAHWVDHTEQVKLTLERTLSALKDAESSTRGFVITRNEVLLEPYTSANAELAVYIRNLNVLVADNPRQRERARELEPLVRARMETLDDVVTAIRAGTFVLPNDSPTATPGMQRMRALRAQIAAMQSDEDLLLRKRLENTSSAHSAALLSVALTVVVAVALVMLLVIADRRAGSRLRRSEQWLSTTLNSIGDGVIATDSKGTIRFLNPVAAGLTGWPQSDAVSKPLESVFRIIAESDRTTVESPVSRVLRDGGVVGLANHTLLIRRDGVECPIEDSGAPIKDQDGTISGVVLVFKDASQARASQVSLQSSEERLRLAVEAAELGAWDRDLTSGREVWNTHLYRIMGCEPGGELTVADALARVAPADAELVNRALERARTGRQPLHIEHRIRRHNDDALRWVAAHGQYLYDDSGHAIRLLGVIRDVTEQRALEQHLRDAQKLDALGTLAGGIAHDFNNILAILRGNLALISTDFPLDHSVRPAVVEMDRACARAAALVRQILTFGSRHEPDRRVIQLETVVVESLRLLRATLPTEIEIHTHFAPNLPAVLADGNQIQQVVTNLGVNAAHAIRGSMGVIEVAIETMSIETAEAEHEQRLPQGHYVRLRLSDTGCGMRPEVLERIFEPFFTTKEVGTGTGLGLCVVSGIVKNHHGAIRVESEPGKGTRFELLFPAAPDQTPTEPSILTEPAHGRGERILFLDDEEALVFLATRLLGRMGYKVAGYSNSALAIEEFVASPHEFDLVLTDLSMPGMNGIEVAQRILSIRPDIPVVVATGYVLPDDVERARGIGVREVIWKPNTVAELGALIVRLLGDNRRLAQT